MDEYPDLGPAPEWLGRRNLATVAANPNAGTKPKRQPAGDECPMCERVPYNKKLYKARAYWPDVSDQLCGNCYEQALATNDPEEYAAQRVCAWCGATDTSTLPVKESPARLRMCMADYQAVTGALRR